MCTAQNVDSAEDLVRVWTTGCRLPYGTHSVSSHWT